MYFYFSRNRNNRFSLESYSICRESEICENGKKVRKLPSTSIALSPLFVLDRPKMTSTSLHSSKVLPRALLGFVRLYHWMAYTVVHSGRHLVVSKSFPLVHRWARTLALEGGRELFFDHLATYEKLSG